MFVLYTVRPGGSALSFFYAEELLMVLCSAVFTCECVCVRVGLHLSGSSLKYLLICCHCLSETICFCSYFQTLLVPQQSGRYVITHVCLFVYVQNISKTLSVDFDFEFFLKGQALGQRRLELILRRIQICVLLCKCLATLQLPTCYHSELLLNRS